MSLREGAIEAAGCSFPSDWLTDDHHINIGVRALDALLDYLQATADEWESHAEMDRILAAPTDERDTHFLIAALRMSSGFHEGRTG